MARVPAKPYCLDQDAAAGCRRCGNQEVNEFGARPPKLACRCAHFSYSYVS